jgi:hypothetical protein
MEIQEALKIMRGLADGISPKTGEVLTSELVYQYAPVVRAFHRAVGALEILEERERSRRTLPANAGRSWSRAEDAQVCDELQRGIEFSPDREEPQSHDRFDHLASGETGKN